MEKIWLLFILFHAAAFIILLFIDDLGFRLVALVFYGLFTLFFLGLFSYLSERNKLWAGIFLVPVFYTVGSVIVMILDAL